MVTSPRQFIFSCLRLNDVIQRVQLVEDKSLISQSVLERLTNVTVGTRNLVTSTMVPAKAEVNWNTSHEQTNVDKLTKKKSPKDTFKLIQRTKTKTTNEIEQIGFFCLDSCASYIIIYTGKTESVEYTAR